MQCQHHCKTWQDILYLHVLHQHLIHTSTPINHEYFLIIRHENFIRIIQGICLYRLSIVHNLIKLQFSSGPVTVVHVPITPSMKVKFGVSSMLNFNFISATRHPCKAKTPEIDL